MKTYYELLELTPAASTDEIKRAFRLQIARYHPDKVQHLGKEFQAMAAARAAELTESYHILSDASRRAEYDRSIAGEGPFGGAATSSSSEMPTSGTVSADQAATAAPTHDEPPAGANPDLRFVEERASRDEFVKKASLGRFRHALEQVAGSSYDEEAVWGFDFACAPKPALFTRRKGPRILGRFVPRVDRAAVGEAWGRAGKLIPDPNDDICIILMGPLLAPERELADAIVEQRRRPSRGGKVTLIAVSTRAWEAHLPTDAPDVAKELLARLRSAS